MRKLAGKELLDAEIWMQIRHSRLQMDDEDRQKNAGAASGHFQCT